MAKPIITGIYEIVNVANGKRYVGSAKCVTTRWRMHQWQLRKRIHANAHLQSAWDKYGEQSFEFGMVMACAAEDLLSQEQAAIDRLAPEYNKCPVAGSTRGFVFTAESRAKISAAHKGKRRDPALVEATAAKLRGRVLPPERVAHLIGNKHAAGTVHTEEHRARLAEITREAYASGKRSRERPPEYREKIAASLRGKKLTPEHKAAVSAAMLGKKRGPYKKKPAAE